MNKGFKAIFTALLLLSTVLLIASCSGEGSHYEELNKKGYTVTIAYDANGGTFSTNTAVICDSYNPSKIPVGQNGKQEILLIAPDSALRESSYTAKNSGYFLAGWYTEREAIVDSDGNHLDYYGNIAAESGKTPAYTYSGAWDFENDKFTLDPNASYSAETHALTLYAAWVPEFAFEFYAEDGTLLDTHKIDPLVNKTITLPYWSTETGKLVYNDIPTVASKTYDAAYYDETMTEAVTGATLEHSGIFNPADASYSGNVMKVYLDYKDGTWYKITTAQQMSAIADPSGHYVIDADLDFTDVTWKLSAIFRGSIYGNGHKFIGVSAKQSSSSMNSGIFAQIAETARIENLTFENASFSLMRGTNTSGATYGLLAGTIKSGATVTGVSITGKLLISPDAKIPKVYNIGLVCGIGYDLTGGIDYSGITVEAIESDTSIYVPVITVSDNDVLVEMRTKGSLD